MLLVAGSGCRAAGHLGTDGQPLPSGTTAPPTSTHSAADDSAGEDGADVAGPLTAERRAALGLPPAGQAPQEFPPLSAQQWADPEAVAARFVLSITNYTAAEDPQGVNARTAVYASERLRRELATSSSGTAGLEDLRRVQAVFRGEVLAIVTEARSDAGAVVNLTVRVTSSLVAMPSSPPRVAFFRLTLSPEPGGSRWLVVGVERS